MLHTAPPAALTSILEVLRHPARNADQLPAGAIPPGYSVLWNDYVRLLAAGPDRIRYFLIPGIDTVPSACVSLLPPSARRRFQTEAREQRKGSVSLEALGSEGGLGAIAYTSQNIEAGKALLVIPGRSSSTTFVSGVVPDGVAAVTITAASATPVTVPVANNFFLTETPMGGQRFLVVQWHAADGSISKTVRIREVKVSRFITG